MRFSTMSPTAFLFLTLRQFYRPGLSVKIGITVRSVVTSRFSSSDYTCRYGIAVHPHEFRRVVHMAHTLQRKRNAGHLTSHRLLAGCKECLIPCSDRLSDMLFSGMAPIPLQVARRSMIEVFIEPNRHIMRKASITATTRPI